MSAKAALIFVGVGTGFNIVGLICGVCALCKTWRAYRFKPIFPQLSNICKTLKKIVGKLKFWSWRRKGSVMHTDGATACVAISGSARRILRVGFPDNISDSEKVKCLIRAVRGIYMELDEDRRNLANKYASLSKRFEDRLQHVDQENRRLEELTREAVSGEVPLQLMGLLLIALGTLLTTIPTIWH